MTALVVPRGSPLRDRILARLVIDPSGCLLWTGLLNRQGYGRITVNGSSKLVHRVLWELEHGLLPDNIQLDHVKAWGCQYKHCANIYAHLEPVTCRENLLRGNTWQARNAAKTRCDRGHDFTPENTYVWRGQRNCRTCHRMCQAKRRASLNVQHGGTK